MRTFWLSFCDSNKPSGEQFLGVCVVDVTEQMAEAAKPILDRLFPQHGEGAEWIYTASRLAHWFECNPGGEMLAAEVDSSIPAPRNRLLQKAEMLQLGLVWPDHVDSLTSDEDNQP